MNQVRKTPRRYEVTAGNQADGVDLPAGTYAGYSKELGVHMLGGLQWTAPTHHLNVTQETLAKIPGMNNLLGLELDVTQDVHAGTIKLAR